MRLVLIVLGLLFMGCATTQSNDALSGATPGAPAVQPAPDFAEQGADPELLRQALDKTGDRLNAYEKRVAELKRKVREVRAEAERARREK